MRISKFFKGLLSNEGDKLDDTTREKIAIEATHFVFLRMGVRTKEKGERDDGDYVRPGTRLKIDLLDGVGLFPEFLKFAGSNGSHRILGFAAIQDVSDDR